MDDMSSPQGGRPLLHRAVDQRLIRKMLMDHYRKEPLYQQIVKGQLQHLWLDMMTQDPSLIISQIRDGSLDSPVARFYTQVDEVLSQFRLMYCHSPARWARELLLADIPPNSTNSSLPSLEAISPIDQVNLQVEVSPSGAELTLTSTLDDLAGLCSRVGASGTLNFDQWDLIGKEAHRLIGIWIDGVRTAWHRREDYRFVNATYNGEATADRLAQQVEALFGFLFHEMPIDRDLRDQLRRLCGKIELDLPTWKELMRKKTT